MDNATLAHLLAVVPLLAVWSWCLLDVMRTEPYAVRTFTKEQWVWIVLLLNIFGAVMWLAKGRPDQRS